MGLAHGPVPTAMPRRATLENRPAGRAHPRPATQAGRGRFGPATVGGFVALAHRSGHRRKTGLETGRAHARLNTPTDDPCAGTTPHETGPHFWKRSAARPRPGTEHPSVRWRDWARLFPRSTLTHTSLSADSSCAGSCAD